MELEPKGIAQNPDDYVMTQAHRRSVQMRRFTSEIGTVSRSLEEPFEQEDLANRVPLQDGEKE